MATPREAMAELRTCSPQSSRKTANLLAGGGANPSTADRAPVPAGASRAGREEACRRAQVTAPRPMACAGGDDLVREFKTFKRSAPPSRVLYFTGEAWKDFPPAVVGELREGFAAGRPMVQVPVGGSPSLFDFVRMVQIDAATAAQRPIAWIDVEGWRFFPRMAAGGGPKPEIDVRTIKDGGAAPSGEHWGENRIVVSAAGGLQVPSWAGLQALEEGDKSYKLLEKIFLAGMQRTAPATRVTAIRRCTHGGAAGRSRLRTFQVWAEITRAARGTANVQYGWYGAQAEEVSSVVAHGFGRPNNGSLRPAAFAVGVYLAPPHLPHASAAMAEADGGGERHVVLCRVIMGKAEKVDMGLPRWHPTGDEFDSGVDDVEKPRWYVVWGTRMNTHIQPEYVVSFKTSDPGSRVRGELAPRTTTRAQTWLRVPELISELGKSLPSLRVQAVEMLYNRLKSGKITKDVFLRNLRTITGDKLHAAIKKFHNYES